MDRPSSLSFKAGEIVYNIDTKSNEAYIITEGEVNLFSRDGFLLASLSNGEMFGETSVITGKNRSITAKAGANGLRVTIIPKSNLTNILQKDPILGALWKKTQLRLLDSNKKNSELFIEVEAITEELEQSISEQKALSKKSEKLSERISRIKQLLYSSEW